LKATVKFSFKQKAYRQGDISGFLFEAKLSEPEGFPDYLKDNAPHKAFVYKVMDVTDSSQASFARVASVEDLKELPFNYSTTGDEYRVDTYATFFPTIEEVLGAKELLTKQLRFLYSGVNTLFTYVDSAASDSTIILPDYIETKVSGYIKDLISKRYKVKDLQTKITLLENTVKPTLAFDKEAAESQRDVLTEIITYATETPFTAVETHEFNGALNNLTSLVTNIEVLLHEANTDAATLESTLTTVNNTLSDLRQDSAGQLATLQAMSPADRDVAAIDKIESALFSYGTMDLSMRDCTIKAAGIRNAAINPGAAYRSYVSSVKNALKRMLDVNIFQTVKLDELQKIGDLIKDGHKKVLSKIVETDNEIVKYKEEAEILKGDIQILEGKLLQLVPSIDLDHPESYWFVQVDIKLGSN